MWREGEGKREPGPNHPVGRSAPGPKGGLRADLAETCLPTARAASSGRASSGTRNDRGRLEGRDHGVFEGVMITLEQHPPFEST